MHSILFEIVFVRFGYFYNYLNIIIKILMAFFLLDLTRGTRRNTAIKFITIVYRFLHRRLLKVNKLLSLQHSE